MIFKGDVYYADLNPVIGSEQGGVRPVVILQNDIGNKYSPTTIVAPMTTKSKTYVPMHVTLKESFLAKKSTLLLEQIRTIDKQRLKERIGKLDSTMMSSVDKALYISFGMV
jgi:mRNA interferase MazF